MKEKTEKVTELEEGEDVLRREKQRREERGRSSFISMASLSLSLSISLLSSSPESFAYV